MCNLHGGGNRCQHIDSDNKSCTKSSPSGSDMCTRHGGGNRCQYTDDDGPCKSSAIGSSRGTGLTGRCVKHGGGNRCQHEHDDGEICNRFAARGDSDSCYHHGGGDICEHIENGVKCNKLALGGGDIPGMCGAHGGGKRCQFEEAGVKCQTAAVNGGIQGRCTLHGGGKRCQHIDDNGTICPNGAASNTTNGTGIPNMCRSHGGGNRCQFKEINGDPCLRTSEYSSNGTGNSNMCMGHGGGNRCQHSDENGPCKSAVMHSSNGSGIPERCCLHGGGNRCQHINKNGSKCTKGAAPCSNGLGIPDMCIAHGGGDRCEMMCCNSPNLVMQRCLARGKHPDTGERLCTFAMRCLVQKASEISKSEKDRFIQHFGFKSNLVIRAEHVFYHALCVLVPALTRCERVLDESVIGKCIGKTKSCRDLKPDYFHFFADGDIELAIHGEYDEDNSHEDSDQRLDAIANASGCGPENVYIFRVCGHHQNANAVCRRVKKKDHSYYVLTSHGETVVQETAVILRERLEWIGQGLPPGEGRERKVYINL